MALLTRADLTRFQKGLEAGDYTSALEIAERFGLDKDDVYKSQWSASDFGTEAIRNVLSRVEDGMWVVKECQDRIGPTFESMNALLSLGLRVTEPYASSQRGNSSGDKDWCFRLKRLRLLQYKDRLDSFLGINNGRYSQKEYEIFRSVPLDKVALGLAERGKTGALNLLFKWHPYSLAPYILQILDSIPESLPPHNYGQLLPDGRQPKIILPRKNEDPVETADILEALKKTDRRGRYQDTNELDLEEATEHMVKLSKGLVWPTRVQLVDWYKTRARDIDKSCGLLENSHSLLDLGVGKGLEELESDFEDISDLYGVVFSSDSIDSEVGLRLSDWESLSKFEKFKLILDGATEESAGDRLRERAVPFMIRNQTLASPSVSEAGPKDDVVQVSQSFLVRWLKLAAKENKLSLCAAVLSECCREPRGGDLFRSDDELVETVLDCIYACTRSDEWTLMSSMLAKLPRRESRAREPSAAVEDVQRSRGLRKGFMKAFRGAVGGKTGEPQLAMTPLALNLDETTRSTDDLGNSISETLEGRVRQAEYHVVAGQILSQYQVAKPISFFLVCKEDVNSTKQLLRILLLKFSNRELAKSDNGWASLWRDLRILQEKAFPFLDKEFLLSELCQGILKAGKFSLAKNYLKGTGTTILRTEKAEKLVLNAAREYFYSAPDIDSAAIGKARQCLNLLPPSKALTAEINLIDALTIHLPSFGVTLLPVQFRQMSDSMEVVKLAISSHAGAYLNIPEIMELARLLGLSSPDDVSAIESAIAREAAAAGDFGLARDLCLELVKKGHGPIWDLCAALGRGPDFEQMDLNTRKELIGFALCHCDEDSVGELLGAWKEFDLLNSCDSLARVVGRSVVSLAEHDREVASLSERLESQQNTSPSNEKGLADLSWQGGFHALSLVAAEVNKVSEPNWESFAKDKRKALGFVCLQLPWLCEVSSGNNQTFLESDSTQAEGPVEPGPWRPNLPKECQSPSAQAVALILRALASYDIVPDDKLVLRLAEDALSRPVSKEEDTVGCGYLLNLRNSYLGAEILEKELEKRENYQQAYQALELALSFSMLQKSVLDLQSPNARREMLTQALRERKLSLQGGSNQVGSSDGSFWREFSLGAVEKLRVAEESRRLQKILPGVDAQRFIFRDREYIQEKIFSLVDSVKVQQEKWLPTVLTLAEEYNVEQWQVLKGYFLTLLKTKSTSESEVITEISGYWSKLLLSSDRFADTLEVYNQVVIEALESLRMQGTENKAVSGYRRTLVRALFSLSEAASSATGETFSSNVSVVDRSEMLNRVRHAVWQKLCQFARDLQAPLRSRIFILELLETVRMGKAPRRDFWQSCQLGDEDLIISWGKWEAEGGDLESLKEAEETGGEETLNTGGPVNVLLALRSTHIISSKWPGWEVTPAVLSSPETATSFFELLEKEVSSVGHANALKALLEEWESAFGSDAWGAEDKKDDATLKRDQEEDWVEDSGGGWEEFNDNNWTVHTLHSCWKATLQKLTEFGGLREALGVLDAALLHPTSVLVTEDEAKDLIAVIGPSRPSAALQLSLLLPYHSAQVLGLQLLEKKLHKLSSSLTEQTILLGSEEQEADVQPSDTVNQELMALVLSSGLLPSTAADPSLVMVFSALCQSLGYLALQLQELQLSMKPTMDECLVSVDQVPFCVLAFPFFIAELTKAKNYMQAGCLVLQFMRVHPALATLNASHMGLQRYLSTQADGAAVEAIARRGKEFLHSQGDCRQLGHLRNTTQSLACRLEEVLKSALKALSKDMK